MCFVLDELVVVHNLLEVDSLLGVDPCRVDLLELLLMGVGLGMLLGLVWVDGCYRDCMVQGQGLVHQIRLWGHS